MINKYGSKVVPLPGSWQEEALAAICRHAKRDRVTRGWSHPALWYEDGTPYIGVVADMDAPEGAAMLYEVGGLACVEV